MKNSIWNQHSTWNEAESAWEKGSEKARATQPIRKLKVLPEVPGITQETSKRLKWKSLKYMVLHDKNLRIFKHFLKRPFLYAYRYLKSVFKKKSYLRDGDFFLYGFPSLDAFETSIADKESILAVGFSYCQKPHECPSGRFTDKCLADANNPICRQCDIGKTMHALPAEQVIPLIIPTVHYIGDKMFELVHKHPKKKILFLITACEMTLEMFGDYGHMAGLRGVGIRLDGRICNTMRAFELSEEGIKPGLTVVIPNTQERLLAIIQKLRHSKK